MQLEIEEHVELGDLGAQAPNHVGPLGHEKLQADLDQTHVTAKLARTREGGVAVGHVESGDDAAGGGGGREHGGAIAGAAPLRQAAPVATADPRQALFDALEDAVARGVCPGCVALVWADGAELFHEAHGQLATVARSPACGVATTRDTRFDLASLTKPLATATLAALAVSEGRLRLGDEVPAPWRAACPGATLGDLLAHRAGLPAHVPFYDTLTPFDRAGLAAALARVRPEAAPGTRTLYGDLGPMIAGLWLERVYDAPLDVAFHDRVARPLGLADTQHPILTYHDLVARPELPRPWRVHVAPSERYVDRPEATPPSYVAVRAATAHEAHGQVHDDNAFVAAGVAGHAGLFGTAFAVLEVARAWLDDLLPGLDPTVRDRFWAPAPGTSFRVGWDGPSPGGSTGGALEPGAVGHLGFTGTSLWIEPGARRIYVLLSNRVYPFRGDAGPIRALRQHFHRLAAAL